MSSDQTTTGGTERGTEDSPFRGGQTYRDEAPQFVLPLVVSALPASWSTHISKYLPLHMAGDLVANDGGAASLSHAAAVGLLAAYAVAALGLGLVVLKRRDV